MTLAPVGDVGNMTITRKIRRLYNKRVSCQDGQPATKFIETLVALASRSSFSQGLKRYGIEHNDRSVFETYPITPRPNS
jgi:hypothetical protein